MRKLLQRDRRPAARFGDLPQHIAEQKDWLVGNFIRDYRAATG